MNNCESLKHRKPKPEQRREDVVENCFFFPHFGWSRGKSGAIQSLSSITVTKSQPLKPPLDLEVRDYAIDFVRHHQAGMK